MKRFFSKEKIQSVLKTPNILTLSRIVATPVIVVVMTFYNQLTGFIAALIFSLAAITDFFDGYLARKNGGDGISEFGTKW